jgi:short-subunit dehydrogenase
LENHEHLISLNIHAVLRLTYAFLRNAKSGDALINVSSLLSLLPFPGGAVYGATKGFVTNFTNALWYEYKRKNVYIMALLPGRIMTEFQQIALGDKAEELPDNYGDTPEMVAKEALHALKERKQPTVICGKKNRKLSFLATRILKRKKMIEIMGNRNPALK